MDLVEELETKGDDNMFFKKLIKRLEKTILSFFKPSFLTWAFVTFAICKNWIKLDSFLNYAIFTCAIVGIKAWEKTKEKINSMQ